MRDIRFRRVWPVRCQGNRTGTTKRFIHKIPVRFIYLFLAVFPKFVSLFMQTIAWRETGKKPLYIRDSLTSVNLPILLTISYRTHCPRQSRSAFVLLVLFGDLFKYSPALFRANINNFIARPGNQCQSLKVTRRREQSVPWLRHGGVSTTGEYTFGRVRSFPVKRILVKPCFL